MKEAKDLPGSQVPASEFNPELHFARDEQGVLRNMGGRGETWIKWAERTGVFKRPEGSKA